MKELNKAITNVHGYFNVKGSNGIELARGLMYGHPETTKGMFVAAQEIIALVAERGLNGEYQYNAEMEHNSIIAREMLGF